MPASTPESDTSPSATTNSALRYPEAERVEIVETLHGQEVADPYRWLEDTEDPRTQKWSAEQDALFAAQREQWPGKPALESRITELVGAGVVTVPVWRGERQFLLKRTADQEHAVLLVIDADGTERTLIDPMVVDPTGATTLDAWQPSKEGQLLAYQLSEGGTEESVLRVMDVGSGEDVDGPIDRARYSPVAWVPGGKSFYYVRRLPAAELPEGEEQFHRRVWWHQLGTSPDDDVMIFGDGLDPTNYYGVSVSLDGRWLSITSAAGTEPRNDLWVADLEESSHSDPQLITVQSGVDAQTQLQFGRHNRVYAYTNLNAPRGRIMVTEPGVWDPSEWTELVPEHPESVLEGWSVLDG
jgi:prolyl oligopeptidase